jgi:hypothetical protein
MWIEYFSSLLGLDLLTFSMFATFMKHVPSKKTFQSKFQPTVTSRQTLDLVLEKYVFSNHYNFFYFQAPMCFKNCKTLD